ncbi:hypothetical protein MMC11_007911 [Xylographa trunciseda]|nr:hypothetical protein [Xylographa trunciseda]
MTDRRRRRSLSIFRPSVNSLTPIHDGSPSSAPALSFKKKFRQSSTFSMPPTPTSPLSSPVLERTDSERSFERSSSPITLSRPRTLQKVSRPSSIFGSFRSLHSLQDEDENLIRTQSTPSSVDEDTSSYFDVLNMIVLHHGEVQSGGGMFRKKNTYLVLTNSHLLRFKSHAKAAEAFPSIPASLARNSTIRHSRLSSAGSTHETSTSTDGCVSTRLSQVVAVYKLDDGRPYFTIEVAHLDEETNQASTMSILLNDPRESDLWLSSIRAAITKSRLTDPTPPIRRTIEYLVKAVEYECDYDPLHFRVFKVVQRATKTGTRSSSDDLAKLTSNIYYLVIGFHKVHLVPLSRLAKSGSSTSLSESSNCSHGVVALTSIFMQRFDDAFQLAFRIPLQPSTTLFLASSSVTDIALWLRHAADFLRPTWLEQPFLWHVPRSLDDSTLPISEPAEEDHFCFDRTLTAYCSAYNVDPSNIRYTVNYSCEDAPQFELLEPNHSRRTRYTVLELLSIMRALRYNESFHSISFRNIDLSGLHGLSDNFGSEHLLWSTRSGAPLPLPLKQQSWLLVQEIQSLALKSKRLRRLNFFHCLKRKPRDENGSRDPGSGICEALFPLCAQQLTNVDWITLNGVSLAEIDIDYLYAAAIEKSCHFRAVDLGHCGLGDGSLKTVMEALLHQEETLESVDYSGNPVRLNPELLAKQLCRLQRVRKLDLSNTHCSAGKRGLLESGTLLRWRLEELSLSGTTLNEESVDALASYFADSKSNTLRRVQLNQCQLSGKDVAKIIKAMCADRPQPRELELQVSENKIELGHDLLVEAFRNSTTPTQMTMQMLEYTREQNFRDLIEALSANKSLSYLDISRTSLPFNANEQTCKVLRHMLETNDTLQELDISGEETHLEAVTLGPGLRDALKGLEANRTLKVLRIEHQALGLPGANTLASILEKNHTLSELYCEDNGISLQSFTLLVNALRNNTSVLHLPNMDKDRAWSRQRVDREIDGMRDNSYPAAGPSTKSSVRKAFSGAIHSGRSFSGRGTEKPPPMPGYTEQDFQAAVASLDQRWDAQVRRLQGYLRRNYCMAHGLPLPEDDATSPAGENRKGSAGDNLAGALMAASLDRTPKTELDLQLGDEYGVEEDFEKGGVLNRARKAPEEYSEKLIDIGDDESDSGGELIMARARPI